MRDFMERTAKARERLDASGAAGRN